MIRFNTCAASIALALSGTALAAPTAPSIDMYGSNNLQFSKIELAMETTSGYNQMVLCGNMKSTMAILALLPVW